MLITLVMITFQIQIAKSVSSLYMFVVHISSRNMGKETNFTKIQHSSSLRGRKGRTERGR